MIIEKLSQYLTLTNQHKAMIAKIQDGICEALTRHFLDKKPDTWQALNKRIQDWDGRLTSLKDPLPADFDALVKVVKKHQFGPGLAPVYLGDNLKSFLENQKDSFILHNPWHSIAVHIDKEKNWIVYDPNYVAEPKKAKTIAELEGLIHQAIGHLVSVDSSVLGPKINNVNQFLAAGGLLALLQANNKKAMLSQLESFNAYTKEALDGLLVRNTSGTPVWIDALKNPDIAPYTLKLLLEFQKKDSKYLEQLQRSMQAMSSQDRHEWLVALVQLKTSVPEHRAFLETLAANLRPITRHDYRRQLETWRTASIKAPSLDAFCELMVAKELNKKQLVTLDSNTKTNALSLALLAHCKAKSRPVFPVNSPDDLICSASWVERQADGSGIAHKGPGGPLYEFLKKHKGEAPVLVVNYDRFKADDIIRFNSLLDEIRKADGTVLDEDVVVLGLMNPHAPKAYKGADFYSRFKAITSCPVSDEELEKIVPQNPKAVTLEETKNHYLINLAHSNDWEGLLFGRWIIKKDKLVFEEGELDKALKANKPISLQNAPWDNVRFQTLWQQALILKSINHAGRSIPISSATIPSQTSGYDWASLKDCLRLDKIPEKTRPVIVNPKLLRDLFYNYQCDAKTATLDTLPGLLQQNKKGTLVIYLTRTLSEDEWGILLLACKEHQVTLSCELAPGVTLPESLAKLFPDLHVAQPSPVIPWNKGDKKNPLVMSSTDVAATLALITHKEADWEVFDISECDASQLLGTLDGQFNADKAQFVFSERMGALRKALKDNKKVLLHGPCSAEVMDSLAPLLLKTESSAQLPPGQLVLVSTSAKPFNYCPCVHHEVTVEERKTLLKTVCGATNEEIAALPEAAVSFNHLRAHLKYKRAFPEGKSSPWQGVYEAAPLVIEPFNAERSKQIADDFLEKRLHDVKALLSQSPFVCITGLTGIGKTSFIDKHLAKEPGIKVYYDIDAWMADKTPGRKKILLLDEYNLIQKQLSKMEGLFTNPPGILNETQYTQLTPEHQVVCLGNPFSTGGERQEIPLIERHGNALEFTPLPPEYIYEYVLKQVFKDTRLQAQQLELAKPLLEVYRFIAMQSKDEVLISPREVEMMALLAVSYATRYPKTTHTDHLLAIKHYAYRIGRALNKPEHLANFDAQFKPKPNEVLPYEALPQYKNEKKKFLVTESRKAISQQLDDLLALHEFRCHDAKTEEQKYGGLGGLILDGEAGIGKSELVEAALVARGFELVSLDSKGPLPKKPFYHMPVSMQLDDKIKLLLKAFNEGAIVLIDEINSSPMMERLLNSLLMGKTLDNKPPAKPGFCIIGTQNPPLFGGRFIPSNALSRRLSTEKLAAYSEQEMEDILVERKLNRDEAKLMIKDFQYNREKAERERLSPVPSFRDLLHLADKVAAGLAKKPLSDDASVKVDEKVVPRRDINLLMKQINVLRDYGDKINKEKDKLSKDEGGRAMALANKLDGIATKFAQPCSDKQNLEYRTNFTDALKKGYQEMGTHRGCKAILLNIAIAASIVGLLFMISNYVKSGTPFFSAETKRQAKVQLIKDYFETFDNPESGQDLSSGPQG